MAEQDIEIIAGLGCGGAGCGEVENTVKEAQGVDDVAAMLSVVDEVVQRLLGDGIDGELGVETGTAEGGLLQE